MKNLQLLKAFRAGYFEYKKLFADVGLELGQCELIDGVNIVLLVDRKRSIVYRCALNALGREGIINNYKFLTESKIEGIPAPIALVNKGGAVVSAERFLPGKPVGVNDQERFSAIMDQLSSCYKVNLVQVEFDVRKWFEHYDRYLYFIDPVYAQKLAGLKVKLIKKWPSGHQAAVHTYIHGDLTFRNILVEGSKIFFFDFDRSCIDFPEFDALLFHLDLLTHQTGRSSYDVFLDHLAQFAHGKADVPLLEGFYDRNPAFAGNTHIQGLKYLFLYRALIFGLYDLNNKEKFNLNRFDKLLQELDEASSKDL